MRFDECTLGEYHIVVGALEAPRGDGYIAAVVVSRMIDESGDDAVAHDDHAAGPRQRRRPAREVWRDDSLACGYRWPTAEAALHYAKNRAREMVRKASPSLG